MTSTDDSARRRRARVLLFPSCDRDGLLLDALSRRDDEPPARAEAMLFGWMLGLDAAVDAVGAACAVLSVAAQHPHRAPQSAYRRALIEGLERFVADDGRVASLSTVQPAVGARRTRRRWRDRDEAARKESDEQRKTRR